MTIKTSTSTETTTPCNCIRLCVRMCVCVLWIWSVACFSSLFNLFINFILFNNLFLRFSCDPPYDSSSQEQQGQRRQQREHFRPAGDWNELPTDRTGQPIREINQRKDFLHQLWTAWNPSPNFSVFPLLSRWKMLRHYGAHLPKTSPLSFTERSHFRRPIYIIRIATAQRKFATIINTL